MDLDSFAEQNRLAFMTCIEIAIMRRGNTNYHLVMAKLDSLYHCKIMDCYEHPERLRTVLKDVYKKDYDSVLDDIESELYKLVDVKKEIDKFLKIMKH